MSNPRSEDSLASLCKQLREIAEWSDSSLDQEERDAMREVCDRAEEMLAALKELHLKAIIGTDEERHAALTKAWMAIHNAEALGSQALGGEACWTYRAVVVKRP